MVHELMDDTRTTFDLDVTNCPLCGRRNKVPGGGLFRLSVKLTEIAKELYHVADESAIEYTACGCGLFYASRYIDADEMRSLYEDGNYRMHLSGSRELNAEILADDTRHSDDICAMVWERLNDIPGDVLDIGCSSGVMVRAMAAHYGVQPFGVEYNKYLRDYLSEQGTPNVASIDDLDPGRKFGLITLSHVLEHTLDPVQLLTAAKLHLSPGGRIFIQVPIMMPGPPHPVMFSDAAGVMLALTSGLQIDWLDNRKYLSIMSQKAVANEG